MGLFDDFRITSGPFEGERYQTKDLGRAMRTYRVGESAVLEEQTVHREKRALTEERREELQAYVEERGEGLLSFHEQYALDNGHETVVTPTGRGTPRPRRHHAPKPLRERPRGNRGEVSPQTGRDASARAVAARARPR